MITKKSRRGFLLLMSIFFCLVAQTGSVFAKDQKTAAVKIQALNDQIVAANEARDLPAALQAAEEAVRVAKKEFGEDSVEAADTMNNLASLYLHIKRSAEAEQFFKKSILIYLKEIDKESPEIANSFVNLGVAYASQKKYKEAFGILNKALTIRLKKLGPDDDSTKQLQQMIDEITKLAYPDTEVL